MKSTSWLLGTAVFVTAISVAAAPPGAFSAKRLSDVDKQLSSDAFQGRGTGSAIEPTVIQYIADQFRAAGVQPGGDVVERQALVVSGSASLRIQHRRHAYP